MYTVRIYKRGLNSYCHLSGHGSGCVEGVVSLLNGVPVAVAWKLPFSFPIALSEDEKRGWNGRLSFSDAHRTDGVDINGRRHDTTEFKQKLEQRQAAGRKSTVVACHWKLLAGMIVASNCVPDPYETPHMDSENARWEEFFCANLMDCEWAFVCPERDTERKCSRKSIATCDR